MSLLIAIVDDEEDIVNLVSMHLKKAGFETKTFLHANKFLDFLLKKKPDLVVLDIMLPDMNGKEVCKIIKNNKDYSDIFVIMLTAVQDEVDKLIGFEIGADDYITKPFSPRELVARVKAVLKRAGKQNNGTRNNSLINIDQEIFIDVQKHKIFDKNKKEIILTLTEFNILLALLENRDWVYSREQLINKAWGEETYITERSVDVHINNMRKKLGKTGKLIKNIRGLGYKFASKE